MGSQAESLASVPSVNFQPNNAIMSCQVQAENCSFVEVNTSSGAQGKDILKPEVGMTFNSLEEGELFYNEYAKQVGFVVRRHTTRLHKDTRERIYQSFVCSKQGIPRSKTPCQVGKAQRKRAIIKEDCMACMKLQKSDDIKWFIKKFEERHSHAFVTPTKRQFLVRNREVTEAHRNLMNTFKEANLRTSQVMTMLEITQGDYSDIGCTERDLRNELQKDRDEQRDYDAHFLLEYFEGKKTENPSFFYEFKVDDDKRLTHMFWADGLARKSWHHFGDVLVFDTTYSTNQYSMIFAPFTGVNHHGQSVNFGAGFLKDETIPSFLWLFETWQRAMSGCQPSVIITDQDAAMASAIGNVFPFTHHRLCMWHILKKLNDKLGAIAHRHEFIDPFLRCVWNSKTPIDFEIEWESVMSNNKLKDHEWLNSLFMIRDRWIPAYAQDKNIFTAGIRTTQRAESMNAFIDKFVNNKNTLLQFMLRFDRAIKRQQHNLLASEHKNLHTKPQMVTGCEMEVQMAAIYTRAKFYIFQDELLESMKYAANIIHLDEHHRIYMVKRFCGNTNAKPREVNYHGHDERAKCSCKKFESEGIPCRHILVVLRSEFIATLPPHYIMKRWTICATNEVVFDDVGVELGGRYGKQQNLTIMRMTNDFHAIVSMVKNSEKLQEFGAKWLSDARKAIQDACGTSTEPISNCVPLPSTITIHPPKISKTKGSGRRIKSGTELAITATEKAARLCRCCKKFVHHDSRNCPLKLRCAALIARDENQIGKHKSPPEEGR